eukprot:2846348-Alexandrium_andersonii.AAC.1
MGTEEGRYLIGDRRPGSVRLLDKLKRERRRRSLARPEEVPSEHRGVREELAQLLTDVVAGA